MSFTKLQLKNEMPVELWNALSEEQIGQIVYAIENNKAILITGPQLRTGKTTLANILKKLNLIAYEKWEVEEIDLNKKLT